MKFVSYYRVSTARQGQSGLGLDGQRAAVDGYVAGRGGVIGEYVEIESGKNNDRPQLTAALAMAKAAGATLLIAKLDRLGRNVHFISGLLESAVEVCAADNPNANRMMMQMFAVFAEEEGRAISERTKAALAAAKARGTLLGMANPKVRASMDRAVSASVATRTGKADTFAANIRPLIERLRSGGASLRQIAAELNARGIKTARSGKWQATTVRNILTRIPQVT